MEKFYSSLLHSTELVSFMVCKTKKDYYINNPNPLNDIELSLKFVNCTENILKYNNKVYFNVLKLIFVYN